MLRRALGILKNLGNWTKANMKRTILAKLKKGGKKDDKENVSVISPSHFMDSDDTHLKDLNGTISVGKGSQFKESITDTSNTHSHLHHDATHEIPHMSEPSASDGSLQNKTNELQCHGDVEITGNEQGNKQVTDARILDNTAGRIFTDAAGIDDEIKPQINVPLVL
jgi:hypothetical protein